MMDGLASLATATPMQRRIGRKRCGWAAAVQSGRPESQCHDGLAWKGACMLLHGGDEMQVSVHGCGLVGWLVFGSRCVPG
jgi:hypothetical protein